MYPAPHTLDPGRDTVCRSSEAETRKRRHGSSECPMTVPRLDWLFLLYLLFKARQGSTPLRTAPRRRRVAHTRGRAHRAPRRACAVHLMHATFCLCHATNVPPSLLRRALFAMHSQPPTQISPDIRSLIRQFPKSAQVIGLCSAHTLYTPQQ